MRTPLRFGKAVSMVKRLLMRINDKQLLVEYHSDFTANFYSLGK